MSERTEKLIQKLFTAWLDSNEIGHRMAWLDLSRAIKNLEAEPDDEWAGRALLAKATDRIAQLEMENKALHEKCEGLEAQARRELHRSMAITALEAKLAASREAIDKLLDEIERLHAELAEARANKLIPVNAGKPTTFGKYLCAVKYPFYEKAIWQVMDQPMENINIHLWESVTHWRLLPPPPSSGGKEAENGNV